MELKFQTEYESQWTGKSEFFLDEQQIENMIINWDELSGKTLTMFSYKSGGIRVVGGREESTGKTYILLTEHSKVVCQKDLFFPSDKTNPSFVNGRSYLFQVSVLNVDVWDDKERRHVFSHSDFAEYFKIQ